jgi:transcription elongation GreA/GreB family factor
MAAQQQPGEPSPHEAIVAALARIAAAYPALTFADERATEEAGAAFRRAVRLVEYQLRRAIPAPRTPAPPRLP